MALNKTNVPIAIGHQSEMDLPADHFTSMNFLLGQPVYYRHMPRKEKLDMRMLGTLRPKPLALPTYGRLTNHLRVFYCPYRLVFPQYDALVSDTIASNYSVSSLVQETPYFEMKDLTGYFLSTFILGVGPLVTRLSSLTDPYDFEVNNEHYVFTAAGRRRYKLLLALGYKIIWDSSASNFRFDCLSLLCYGRIYLDWYANSQYLDSNAVLHLEQLMSYNNPTNALHLNSNDINVLLNLVFAVTYDSDSYFNHAWDNPVAPSNGQWSMPVVNDVTDPNAQSRITTFANGTPTMYQTSASNTNLGTQYIHDMLQKLTNYQRRHALSGARQIDRALVDWGFASDYLTLKRSIYIGNHSIDMQVVVLVRVEVNLNLHLMRMVC